VPGDLPELTAVDCGLFAIFAAVLAGPFLWKKIEQNLELYLFINGVLAAVIAGALVSSAYVWNMPIIWEAASEPLIKGIVPAVFLAGLIFHYGKKRIHNGIMKILERVPIRWFVFLMVVGLGLASSIITAIIAALLLVEIAYVLPLDRRRRVEVVIISCFSIGMGAVLTPLGEPLSTIAITKLQEGFFYLLFSLGVYVLPGLVVFGVIAALLVGHPRPRMLERILLMQPHTLPLSSKDGTESSRAATSAAATPKNPATRQCIFFVKTSKGYEDEAAIELAERAILNEANVQAIMALPSLEGHILVETRDLAELRALLSGLRHCKAVLDRAPEGVVLGHLLENRILETDPSGGELVEIRSGPLKGMKGRVVRPESPGGEIIVELTEGHQTVPVREMVEAGTPPPGAPEDGEVCEIEQERLSGVFIRAGKVYLFVAALLLLGGGMKVLIDKYFALVPPEGLFWANTVSAVLDNATLTAAEISKALSPMQIKSALLALLIAGGMLIPGNIPNIIAAHKLKLGSREWARLGVPLGLGTMLVYFIWLYVIRFP